jgi:SAM-dependent methyltransferase
VSADNISYPSDGNSVCYQLEDHSFWFKHRNDVIENVVRKFKKPGTFADVGGGNGFVAKMVQDKFFDLEVSLIEPGKSGCENAKKRGIRKIYNEILSEHKSVEKYDNIGLFDVIEHIENDQDFLKEVHSRLNDHGRVFITVPAYQSLWSKEDVEAGHFRRYNLDSLIKTARNSGFRVIYSSYFFAILVPLIFLLKSLPFKLGVDNKREAKSDHVDSVFSRLIVLLIIFENWILGFALKRFGASLVMCLEK